MDTPTPINSDEEYSRHRTQADFDNSPTGQWSRLQAADQAQQPVKVLKKGEQDTRKQDILQGDIDIQSGQPVGQLPVLSFNDIEQAKREGELNRQAKLSQSLEAGNAHAALTPLDIDTPAKAVRQAIADTVNKARGTTLNADTVSHYIAEGLTDPRDPIRTAVSELAVNLATDPLTYLPEVGLASTADFVRGAKALSSIGKAFSDAAQSVKAAIPLETLAALQSERGAIHTKLLGADLFYSPTERVIEAKIPNVTTPEQVKATLANSGVSPDEAKWMDLDSYLEGKDKVTKDEVLRFIKSHNVEIREVQRDNFTQARATESFQAAKAKAEQAGYVFKDKGGLAAGWWIEKDGNTVAEIGLGGGNVGTDDPALQPLIDAAKLAIANKGGDTKFQSYALPSGTNYREVLLTLPTTARDTSKRLDELYKLADIRNLSEVESAEMVALERASDSRNTSQVTGETFRSSHFDEPNILVHMRLNDRVDADGKRTLFIEEIQSDWHQKGKREGYQNESKQNLQEMLDRATYTQDARGKWFYDLPDGSSYGGFLTEAYAREAVATSLNARTREGVPNAPFKQTDQWAMLAMKRVLRMAAEEGYDRIAWTTGAQQAERYDLRKHIKSISFRQKKDGTFDLGATTIDGRPKNLADNVSTEKLADYVGKEVAEKIVARSSAPSVEGWKGGGWDFISGIDLKVGGEGMKAFYDDMLPRMVNKYVKKWGARVEDIDLGGVNMDASPTFNKDTGKDVYPSLEVHSLKFTPDITRAVLNNPQSLFGNAFQTVEEYISTLPKLVQTKLRDKFPLEKGLEALGDDKGYVSLSASMFLTRAVLGAVAGVQAGDEEKAIRNSLLGAGLGAFAPQLAKGLAASIRGVKAAVKGGPIERVAETAVPEATGEPLKNASDFQRIYQQIVTDAKRGVRHDLDVSNEADLLKDAAIVSRETIQNLTPGQTLNDAELLAAERVLTDSGRQLLELVDAPYEQFLEAFVTHSFMLDPKIRAAEAETARPLRLLGRDAPVNLQAERAFHDQLRGVMDSLKEGATVNQLREYVRRVQTPEELAVFSRNIVKPGFKDAFIPLIVNSWLTASQSHMWNMLGNTGNFGLSVVDRAFAGLHGGEVRPTEFVSMVQGVFAGVGDSLTLAAAGRAGPAWDLLKTSSLGQATRNAATVATKGREASKFETSKMEDAVRPSFTDVSRLGPVGLALDYLSAFMEGAGGRLLSVSDEFSKSIALQSQLYARTMRDAYTQAEAEQLTGKALTRRANELLTQYRNDIPYDVMQDAKNFAAEVTMTSPLGPFGKWLQEGAQQFTVVKLTTPFIQAPANIFKAIGHHSPAGVFAKQYQADVAAGGVRAELAQAKVATGSLLMGLASLWAADGILIGGGPDPKKFPELRKVMREDGWEPYSINVSAAKRKAKGESPEWRKGDELKPIDRIAPVGSLLGMAADYTNAVLNTSHETVEEYEELAWNLVASTVHIMGRHPFIQGFSQVALEIAYPESNLAKTGTKQAISLTPIAGSGIARTITKLNDPVLREANTYFEHVLKNTPGFSNDLPPVLHPITGKPIVHWPPFRSEYKADVVDDALIDNQVNISTKPDHIDGVKLTPKQQHALQELITTKKLYEGKTLHAALRDMIEHDPDYNGRDNTGKKQQDGDGTFRQAMLMRLIQGYVKLGQAELRETDKDLRRQIEQRINEKSKKLTGEPAFAVGGY